MTDPPPTRRRSAGGGRRSGDPFGIGPRGSIVAPLAAAGGLIVVALLTLALFNRSIPLPAGTTGNNGSGGLGADVTPAPSNVVIVDPRTNVPGTLVFVKQGNLWTQTGNQAVQITTSGRGSMPSWSPDGQWIYYIETKPQRGFFPGSSGGPTTYAMDVPILVRVHPDGSGSERLLSGLFKSGRYTWFYWLRQLRVSPDGKTVALVSDAPDPTKSDVVLQLFDVATGKLRRTNVPENAPLGHQDPAWRPDGKLLLYVKNGRDGTRGAPVIWRYDPKSKKTSQLGGPGYMQPSYSPDGRWVVVARTSSLGTNIAILDARNGTEVLRLTSDDASWAPVWSPAGDSIVYLHIAGQIVDLRMIGLKGTGPTWTVEQLPDVTQYSGLDGGSAPSWYIPADQLPTPSPTAASFPAASASP